MPGGAIGQSWLQKLLLNLECIRLILVKHLRDGRLVMLLVMNCGRWVRLAWGGRARVSTSGTCM